MEEQQSIALLKNGDIAGLELLVRLYQVRAVRAAYLVVRDRAVAEDIVQAAFVRAYDRIVQFDASRPFGPWFLRSVVNDALKAAAREGRQVSLEQEFEGEEAAQAARLIDAAPGPLEILERAETERAVADALDRLTPAQRAAVVLRYYLDFSEAEMVAKMNRPAGTIKWLLHSARKRLRDLLNPPRLNVRPERTHLPEDDWSRR